MRSCFGRGRAITSRFRKGTVPFSLRENRDSPQVVSRPSLTVMLLFVALPLPAGEAGPPQQESEEDFVSLFDGKTLDGWQGDTENYVAEEGKLVCKEGHNQRLYTAKEYGDFQFRFEFKQEPGTQGNNGIAIRAPSGGRHLEIQIFNNHHPRAKKLKPYQLHGSIYGRVAAKTGHLKPPGQWNCQEVLCQGARVKVTLNGEVILDANLDETVEGTGKPDARPKGPLGFLGHHNRIEFRHLRIKEL